jgi:hypothetical protein
MSARTVLAAIGVALAAVLGAHLLMLLAVAVVGVTLTALLLKIAVLVAECGWRVQPCRRRFAW